MNNSTNEFNSTEDSTTEIDTIVVTIEIFISIISVILNLLNIILISISITWKKTYSNVIFLLNSITDVLVGFISIPGDVVLTYTGGSWTYSFIICAFYKTFDYANSNFSLMLLLVITTHRLLQLKDPFKQREEMTRRRYALIFILLVINYGAWFAIWSFYFNKEENRNICYINSFDIYLYVYNCVITLGAFMLIILINFLLLKEFIVKKRKHLGSRNKKEDNAIYCIIAITANLVVCWGLYILIWPIIKICSQCVSGNLYVLGYLLSYAFSVTNPIIILIFNQNYRAILFRKLSINGFSNKSTTKTWRSWISK